MTHPQSHFTERQRLAAMKQWAAATAATDQAVSYLSIADCTCFSHKSSSTMPFNSPLKSQRSLARWRIPDPM